MANIKVQNLNVSDQNRSEFLEKTITRCSEQEVHFEMTSNQDTPKCQGNMNFHCVFQ